MHILDLQPDPVYCASLMTRDHGVKSCSPIASPRMRCIALFMDIGTSPSVRAGLVFVQQFLMAQCGLGSFESLRKRETSGNALHE